MPSGVYKRTREHIEKSTLNLIKDGSWWKGREITDLHRKNLSEAHKGYKWKQATRKSKSEAMKGNKNHFWSGGCLGWHKKQIKERDNYTCQVCGLKHYDIMEVDHLIPRSVRPDLDKDYSNLITLCPNCHAEKTIKEKRESYYRKNKCKSIATFLK